MITIEDIKQLYIRISPYIRKTPLLFSDYFSNKIGATIYFKCENLQYTNSFKVRGAFSKLTSLADKNKTLITASGGNHGLGLCFAGKKFNLKTEVILPKTTPQEKIERIKSLGGSVTLFGEIWDEANVKALEMAKDEKYVYVHPFSDDEVIAGQATIAYEILQDLPDIDTIITSIGGGGLISGISQYAKLFNPNIKIYGVETIGADSMYQSLKTGHVIELPKITSIVESLAARKVTDKTFNIVREYVKEVVRVTDEQAMNMVIEILQQEKLLVEPASSCTLASLFQNQIPDIQNRKVAIVLCGGNISLSVIKRLIT